MGTLTPEIISRDEWPFVASVVQMAGRSLDSSRCRSKLSSGAGVGLRASSSSGDAARTYVGAIKERRLAAFATMVFPCSNERNDGMPMPRTCMYPTLLATGRATQACAGSAPRRPFHDRCDGALGRPTPWTASCAVMGLFCSLRNRAGSLSNMLGRPCVRAAYCWRNSSRT